MWAVQYSIGVLGVELSVVGQAASMDCMIAVGCVAKRGRAVLCAVYGYTNVLVVLLERLTNFYVGSQIDSTFLPC